MAATEIPATTPAATWRDANVISWPQTIGARVMETMSRARVTELIPFDPEIWKYQ